MTWSKGMAQDALLAVPMDVEDLGKLGRRKEACPYYASRAALPEADLVLLPYAALLLQVVNLLEACSLHIGCAMQFPILRDCFSCELLCSSLPVTRLPSNHPMLEKSP